MNNILLIWDIDGTLICSEDITKKTIEQTFDGMFGIKNVCENLTLSGKTDTMIYREICDNQGIEEDCYDKLFEKYCKILDENIAIADAIYTTPGIPTLFELLQKEGIINVLGTGNIEKSARMKLSSVGLNNLFKTGGFGDKEDSRDNIIKKAIQNAKDFYKTEIAQENIYVIGDTPRDIGCAKANNVKSIAVATGNYSVEELKEYSPDFCFSDLRNKEDFLEAIGV